MFMSDEQEELCYKKLGLTSRKTLPQRGPRSGLCGQQMSQQRKVKAKILFSFSILNTSGHQVCGWGEGEDWVEWGVPTPSSSHPTIYLSSDTTSTWDRSRALSQKTSSSSDTNLKSRLSAISASD